MAEDLLAIPAFLDRNKTADAGRQSAHAVLSPSSADRWMTCAGSVRLSIGQPNNSSSYAQEGTDAHQVAASLLTDGRDAWEAVGEEYARGGKDPSNFTFTQEMADAVQVYLDCVRGDMGQIVEDQDAINNHKTEVRFDLGDTVPQCWGTSDRTGYFPKRRLMRVYDFKYGAGIAVDVVENSQLKTYAAGAVHELSVLWDDIDEVELIIVQPRCPMEGDVVPGVRRWRLKLATLGEWVTTELAPSARKALTDDAPVGPAGDHCRFCPARLVCPILKDNFDSMSVDIAVEKQTDLKAMEMFELADQLSRIQPVKFYISALEDEAFRRMMAGEKVPGKKMVAKKSDRVWKSGAEEAIKIAIGDRAYAPAKLMTPAALEKVRGGKELAKEWAFKPDTGLTLADDDDKRQAVPVRTAAEVFAGISGGSAP